MLGLHCCAYFCCLVSQSSNTLWPHGLQHTRPPCPSPSPRACSNSCPLSWWYHPTISSSVIPFSSCLQSFPPSGFFCVELSKCFSCMALRIKLKISLGQQSPAWSDPYPSAKARLFLTPAWHPILLTSFFLCANSNLLRSCFLILCTYCPLFLEPSSPRSHRPETSSFRLLVT